MATHLRDHSEPREPFVCALPARYVEGAATQGGLEAALDTPPLDYFLELAEHLVDALEDVPPEIRTRHLADMLMAEAVNRRMRWCDRADSPPWPGLFDFRGQTLRSFVRGPRYHHQWCQADPPADDTQPPQ